MIDKLPKPLYNKNRLFCGSVICMAREYEIVSSPQFRYLNIFMVRMLSRTTHIHAEIELGLILDGSVLLKNSMDSWKLQKGDIYLVNSLEPYEFVSKGKGALILSIQLSTRLTEAFLPEKSIYFQGSSRLADHFSGNEEQYDLLYMLCVELAYSYFGRQQDFEYKCFSLTAQLLHHIKREIPNQTQSHQGSILSRQKNDRILSVTNYIDKNFTRKLLEEIAQREGVSMTYLSHLFKDVLGISFQEYLKRKRFEYACILIATTQRKILDISISSGFSDVRYLTKLFQAQFGCSPREYRIRTVEPREKESSPLESSEYWFAPRDSFLLLTPIQDQAKRKWHDIPIDSLW